MKIAAIWSCANVTAIGLKDLALEVATDPDHKFDLALSLNRLDIALGLAKEADVEHKWKSVGGM